MRALIAALVGGALGFGQFLFLVFLDASDEGSSIPRGDFGFWLFAATWIAQLFALVTIAMYRLSPWVARLLRDRSEADRILHDKTRHVTKAEWFASGALILRAILRLIDSGHLTGAIYFGVLFGVIPFVLPAPTPRKGLGEPVQSNRGR